MDQIDPKAVPIHPAATVMLIDDRPDLQIFMMQRNVNTVFAGGMWVFPGGRVDSYDGLADFASLVNQGSDPKADPLLDIATDGLGYYVAAIRETFEEAGILLASAQAKQAPLAVSTNANQKHFAQYRQRINQDGQYFLNMLKQEQLLLNIHAMHYIARWITPPSSPRRFDARFFIARMPQNQMPLHDDHELVYSSWFSPQEILNRANTGRMMLMTPTLRMVRCLAKFSSSDQVLASASANLPDERVRVDTMGSLLLPGDLGYVEADATIENGWVRLRPLRYG